MAVTASVAETIAAKILADLFVRSGFDSAWKEVDPEIQIEIVQTASRLAQEVLDGNQTLKATERNYTIATLERQLGI